MKVSLNWLKEYIPTLKIDSIPSLSEKMISIGLDIEGIENTGNLYDKFVIGEVIEKQMHPNADKLSLCKVDTGDKTLNIVCGAPNVLAGQKVCVALESAIIPNGGIQIKKSRIRGELSEGMICSEKELNLSGNSEGILVLNGEAKIGQNFAEYIGANDYIFEIGITPNRGDLLSHIGVAREIAAVYNEKILLPEIRIEECEAHTSELVKIRIDDKSLCKRFTGRVIKNVKVEESPPWLKIKLRSVGFRPKNNIVDITNFVMFETGQPLHPFDYKKIRGNEIIVRTAKEGDKFVTLDSKERALNRNSLMVCDSEGYTGIAGIMGGQFSEITDNTTDIFLESAYFDPISVRRNSKLLGLQTDASQRFEKGVDIDMVKYASLRATQLIQEIAGGKASKELLDIYPEHFSEKEVSLKPDKVNSLVGINISSEAAKQILEKIEIKHIKTDGDKLIFQIPESRRSDIQSEVDLIEEIARLYGYDNIKEKTNFNFDLSVLHPGKNSMRQLTKGIADYLIGRGFNQILTSPIRNGNNKDLKIPGNLFSHLNLDKIARLSNSLSSEMNSMRSNLLFEMLSVMENNFNKLGRDVSLKFFETGKIFSDKGINFQEDVHLIFALGGRNDIVSNNLNERTFDIFDIKGEVEMFLSKLNLENHCLFYYNDNDLNGIKIDVSLNDLQIGNIYMTDNYLTRKFNLDSKVYFAIFNLNEILKHQGKKIYYKEISKFPSVKRDIALIVDVGVPYDKIRASIIGSREYILKNVQLFDVYRDESIGNDKKSVAVSLEFSSNERTMTDEQINPIMDEIARSLEKNLGAKLRA